MVSPSRAYGVLVRVSSSSSSSSSLFLRERGAEGRGHEPRFVKDFRTTTFVSFEGKTGTKKDARTGDERPKGSGRRKAARNWN